MTITGAMLGGFVALALAIVGGAWRVGGVVAALTQQVKSLEHAVAELREELRMETVALRETVAEVRTDVARLDERTPVAVRMRHGDAT